MSDSTKRLLIVGGLLVVLLLGGPLLWGWGGGGGMMGGGTGGAWPLWMGFGFIFMVVFLALLIAGVVLAVRWVSGEAGSAAEPRESALDILRKRYARGEMDKAEFEAKKKDLA